MKPPDIECEKIHPGLAVADIGEAVKFYTEKLGFTLGFTWGEPPTFAGINLGGQQMFLQKGTADPKGNVRDRATVRESSRAAPVRADADLRRSGSGLEGAGAGSAEGHGGGGDQVAPGHPAHAV